MTAETIVPFPPMSSREIYILLLWSEHRPPQPPLWRGMLETSDGARRYFRTLAQLNRLLVELGNWAE